ncbi:unnamed protein product [Gongylonema pulchrum]|uniref:Ion_trans domain-containing protein n=1 Tax=Gongylonema pulchrum TaxID=637853 RepID=A0A3P6SHQ1_9BILA|nr:unnamed protein product [Gongylonema pulchrum]
MGITFRNLYWSFYGYLAPWDYKLIVGNAGPNQEPTEHTITNYVGEVTIAAFHIAVVITLINLMISMLKNEDLEWKFTRCHIYFEYFEWYTAVPPPFNLIYNTTSMLRMIISNIYYFFRPVRIFTDCRCTYFATVISCFFIVELFFAADAAGNFSILPRVLDFSYPHGPKRSFKHRRPSFCPVSADISVCNAILISFVDANKSFW